MTDGKDIETLHLTLSRNKLRVFSDKNLEKKEAEYDLEDILNIDSNKTESAPLDVIYKKNEPVIVVADKGKIALLSIQPALAYNIKIINGRPNEIINNLAVHGNNIYVISIYDNKSDIISYYSNKLYGYEKIDGLMTPAVNWGIERVISNPFWKILNWNTVRKAPKLKRKIMLRKYNENMEQEGEIDLYPEISKKVIKKYFKLLYDSKMKFRGYAIHKVFENFPAIDMLEDGKITSESIRCDSGFHEIADARMKIEHTPLKFFTLGIGDNSSTDYNNSSFIIEADRKYLVDCPPRVNAILGKMGVKPIDLKDIIITHNHDDHIGGLGAFLIQHFKANKEAENYGKIKIYTTFDIYRDLTSQFYGGGIYKTIFENLVEFVELKDNESFKRQDVSVNVRHNLHAKDTPTISLKFSYKGKTLGYSSDCRYYSSLERDNIKHHEREEVDVLCSKLTSYFKNRSNIDRNYFYGKLMEYHLEEDLIDRAGCLRCGISGPVVGFIDQFFEIDDWQAKIDEAKNLALKGIENLSFGDANWFSDCDMIIHEATDNPNDPVHTYVGELDKLPKEIKEKMVLIHIPDSFKENYAGSIPILREGTKYRI